MEGKDNRSKDKRCNMKQHPSNHAKHNRKNVRGFAARNTTSSSSPQQQDGGVHSIVDVADSSDEPRFARGKGWTGRHGGRAPLPQMNLERLDMPPMDDHDDDNLGGHDDKENAQLCAGDFKQMSELATHGGHFSFEDEKHWNASLQQGELEQKAIDANEYFTLNFKQLSAGLETIPFYKRLDYSSSLFSRDQLSSMNAAAELAEHNYQQHFVKKSDAVVQNAAVSQLSGPAAPDELDELLDITTQEVAKVAVQAATPTATTPLAAPAEASAVAAPADNQDDVQNWLDSVLEE